MNQEPRGDVQMSQRPIQGTTPNGRQPPVTEAAVTTQLDQQAVGRGYPLTFFVDYPERLSRPKTAFRLILAIPILVMVAALVGFHDFGGLTTTWAVEPYFSVTVPNFLMTAGLLVLAPLLMILFRRKYPGGGSIGTSSCCGSRTGSVSTCFSCAMSTRPRD